jgi:hypothetical protein
MLDNDGWGIQGEINRSGWIRLRFILSTFREEILDCASAQNGPENKRRLLYVMEVPFIFPTSPPIMQQS